MTLAALGLSLAMLAGCDGGSATVQTDAAADAAPPELDGGAAPDAGPALDATLTDAATPPDAGPVTAAGLTLAGAGLCATTHPRPGPEPGSSTGNRSPSPFGTGAQQVSLGALVEPGLVPPAVQRGALDTSLDLDTAGFDLYVPPAYDGTTPYGLLMHINSGNSGAVRGAWRDELDAQRLIWVGGRGLGNNTPPDLRMGQTVLGAYRMLELFNIDRSRVYVTGNSGGARSAHMASFMAPQLFRGALPVCGAAWPEPVQQAYETREPDSHYEYWDDWFFPDVDGTDYLTWLAGFAPRLALLTSYDDFREGDIQNVYHHGAMHAGFAARLLEVAGGHCATTAAQLRDALAWIESPDHRLIDDALNDGVLGSTDGVGGGVVDAGGRDALRAEEQADGLHLGAQRDAPALVLLRDRIAWNDPAGAVISVTLAPDGPQGFAGARATAGLWAWQDAVLVDALAGLGADDAPAAILASIEQPDGGAPVLQVATRGADGAVQIVLRGALSDYAAGEAVRVEFQVWSQELQVRTDHHLAQDATVAPYARVLDDRRVLRLRWADAPAEAQITATWPETGSVLAISLQALGDAPVSAVTSHVLARAATGWICDAQ